MRIINTSDNTEAYYKDWGNGPIAGVSIPDSRLAREATELIKDTEPPLVFVWRPRWTPQKAQIRP
jgi:hypothetical protein